MRKPSSIMLPIAVIGGLLGAVTAAAPAQAVPVTLTSGHADIIDVDYTGGDLILSVLDDTGASPVERDPADVIFDVPAAAKISVPTNCNGGWDFLDDGGGTAWVLPQSQTSASSKGILWAGVNTEEVPAGVFEDDELTFELVDVSSTGDLDDFSVYNVLFCPTIRFNSDDGLPDAHDVERDDHAHFNWAFEDDGFYTVTFKVSGTLDGTSTVVSSGEVDFFFDVHN